MYRKSQNIYLVIGHILKELWILYNIIILKHMHENKNFYIMSFVKVLFIHVKNFHCKVIVKYMHEKLMNLIF